MKKSARRSSLLTTALLLTLGSRAVAQNTPLFTRAGVPLPVTNTGNNTLVELSKADSVFAFNIAVASFPPGKKLDWHYHPGGQILVITEGTGYYQERGKPRQVVRKGEVIKCLPGVVHWHGSSAESGVTYMATNPTQKGATVWLEKVTVAQYNGLEAAAQPSAGTGK